MSDILPDSIDNHIDLVSSGKGELTVNKQEKIIYKIHQKIKIWCLNNVNMSNIHTLIIKTMHELNKHKLYGFSKRRMALIIITLLIDEYGSDDVKKIFTDELIGEMIEINYVAGYHRSQNCIII